jgi:predicted AAA+ superfamily ATPase
MIIKRNILKQLRQELTQPEILILLGPRQVGKTTLLKMLEEFCRQKGRKTAFFDLEQPPFRQNLTVPTKRSFK